MYNSKSINDGVEFISQANTRISKTCNSLKKNKYKNGNKNGEGLVLETDTIEGFDINDSAVTAKNEKQLSEMNTNISGYDNKINNLQTSINNITTQSRTFLNSNDQTLLKNKDIKILGDQYGRVNNSGIFKLYPDSNRCGIPETPVSTNINITSAERTIVNPYPILSDPSNSRNVALYGSTMSKGPNNTYPCSDYAGTNIYVSTPINFSYVTDMTYDGAFQNNNSSPALVQQSDMTGVTVKQCVARAMDKGFSVAALNNYNSSTKKGDCYIGNGTVMNGNDPNHFKVITQTDSIFGSAGSRSNISFAADGGVYAGSDTNKFEASIMPSGSAVPVSDLSPLYGGTISAITASYALESGFSSWNNLLGFNSSPIGSPGGRLATSKQYTYYQPVIRIYTGPDYSGRQVTYPRWEWEPTTITTTVAPPSTGYVYINYTCGKINKPPTAQNGVQIGSQFNIDCWDLYTKYPSFSLYLSDDGIITIVNNSGDRETGGLKWTSSNTPRSIPLITLSDGIRRINPRAPRRDWVNGSINGGGGLTSYSNNTPTLTNGSWISSPNGLCRLRFDSNSGKLILEYSLYDVALDPNNDLIGVGGGFSKYSLRDKDNIVKVDNPSVKGKVAYIDIDNGLHEYTTGSTMVNFDSNYNPMVGFTPSGSASKLFSGAMGTEANCLTKCNDTSTCAGYTYIGGTCNTYAEGQIYPKGERIMMLKADGKTLDNSVITQIRNKKIEGSHHSCNKVVNNTSSTMYSSYPVTSNMTKDQKCALGLILDAQMADLNVKKNEAVTKGNEIKGKITGIYNDQNLLKDKINKKSRYIEKGLVKQEKDKDKIDKYIDLNNTSIATVTDTELLLISDNYRYVLWGIVTVLISMAAIKTFRNAY